MDDESLRRAVWRPPWASVEAAVAEVATERGEAVYLVGGYLRDLLLERPARDLDLVVVGDGLAFARWLATRLGTEAELTARFLTAWLRVPGAGTLDVSTARRETYRSPGALPEVEAATIEEDIERRDFTVNSFALGVAGETQPGLLSAPNARRDLEAGRLRVLHPGSFDDDPTRILRGVTLEARLGFRFQPETEALARRVAASSGFDPVSGVRLWQELEGPLGSGDAATVLARLDELGVLAALVPELTFDTTARLRLERSVEILAEPYVETGEESEPATVAALLAVAWKLEAAARSRLAERLALPGVVRRPLCGRAPEIAGRIEGRGDLGPSEIHAELGTLSLPELAVVGAALGERGREIVRLEFEEWRPLRLAIGASDLLEYGAQSGPAVGRALDETLRARLDGRIGREEELGFALERVREAATEVGGGS